MPKYRQKATFIPLAFACREFKKIQYIKDLIRNQTIFLAVWHVCRSTDGNPENFFQSTKRILQEGYLQYFIGFYIGLL